MAEAKAKNLRIYCCGGGGINIGKVLSKFRSTEPGFTETTLTFIDTSESNLFGFDAEVETYLIRDVINDQELDGGAKVRRENAEAISRCAPDIIQKHKPGDFNIVVSTGSGGSGGVIAGTLTSHLLKSDYPTLVFMIGSTDTHLEAENTLKSLLSYEHMARSVVKAPVVLSYFENSPENPRKVVNERVVKAINDLKVLFSGQNIELDTRDLYNWLHFDRCTSNEAKLAIMNCYRGVIPEEEIPNMGNIMSVAILSKEEKDCQLPFYTEYRCTGFLPDALKENIKDDEDDWFFVINDGQVQSINKHLNAIMKEFDDRKNSRIKTDSIVKNAEGSNELGLFL